MINGKERSRKEINLTIPEIQHILSSRSISSLVCHVLRACNIVMSMFILQYRGTTSLNLLCIFANRFTVQTISLKRKKVTIYITGRLNKENLKNWTRLKRYCPVRFDALHHSIQFHFYFLMTESFGLVPVLVPKNRLD